MPTTPLDRVRRDARRRADAHANMLAIVIIGLGLLNSVAIISEPWRVPMAAHSIHSFLADRVGDVVTRH